MKKFFASVLLFFVIFSILAINNNEGFLNLKQCYKESKNCTLEKYSNANEVIINEYTYEKYDKSGLGTIWIDSYEKILTDKGRIDNKVLSFSFTLPYNTVSIEKLQVISPNGSISDIDIKSNSKLMIDSSQMSANIYNPNDKVLTVTIPNLSVGDSIRTLVCYNILKTPMPNTYFDKVLLQGESPRVSSTLVISSSKDLPIAKIVILDEVKGTVKQTKSIEGNNIITTIEATNVPQIYPEPNMPGIGSVVQRVDFSSIKSWADISKWYWNLSKPHLEATTPSMYEKVKELVKNDKTDLEKIYSIYYFVANQIRYLGVIAESEAPGFEPHDVSLTFNNRFGVCRDKAALLVEMLRIAGFKAYPVIINQGDKLDKDVPFLWFNHAITCVEINGKTVFLDPTNETTKDPFPAYLGNRSYLIGKPDGATLETTPVRPAIDNLVKINTNASLNSDGTLDGRTVITFEGINDTIYRDFFSNSSQDDIKNYLNSLLNAYIPAAKIVHYNVYPKNLNDMKAQLSVTLNYITKNAITKDANIAILSFPYITTSFSTLLLSRSIGLTKRVFPLKTPLSSTGGYRDTVRLKLAPNYTLLKTPEFKNINDGLISYEQKLTYNDNELTADDSYMVNKVEYTPLEYLKLRKDIQIIDQNKKIPILLKIDSKSSTTSSVSEVYKENDAIVLNKSIKISINDLTSWTKQVKTDLKVLTYNGKITNSDLKLNYNPSYEKIKVLSAYVITKDGIKHEVSSKEINDMDQSWVSSAPRYTGGKTLVISFPGVEIGSTIHFEYEKTVLNKPFFSDIFYFRGNYPIKDISLSITAPKSIKLKYSLLNAEMLDESKVTNNNNITYSWKGKNLSQLAQENSTPPDWTYIPSIAVSDGDLEKYVQDLNSRLENLSENQIKASEKAVELTSYLKTEKDKIIAIRDYISKKIIQAGPDSFTELPLKELSQADTTLSDGYGDNADIAILYYSMLKSIGKNPEFVLSFNYANIQQIINPLYINPQRGYLTIVLVRVKTDHGYIYLNDTDEFSEYGTTSSEGSAAIGLNSGKLITIEPLVGKKNAESCDIKIILEKDLSAIVSVNNSFYGDIFNSKKRQFALFTQEDRDKYYQELLSSFSKSASAVSELVTNFSSYPGKEYYSFKVKDFAVASDGYYYFKINNIIYTLFPKASSDSRFYPYFIDNQLKFSGTYSINTKALGENFIIYPRLENITLPEDSGKISEDNKIDGPILNYTYNLELTPSIIIPEDYYSLKNINGILTSGASSDYLIK